MNLITSCILTIVTAYATSAGGINCENHTCITASGEKPGSHIATCGPAWSMGDYLWVEDYGIVRCGDRFGRPPAPYAVDVWMETEQEALEWGWRKGVTICKIRGGKISIAE